MAVLCTLAGLRRLNQDTSHQVPIRGARLTLLPFDHGPCGCTMDPTRSYTELGTEFHGAGFLWRFAPVTIQDRAKRLIFFSVKLRAHLRVTPCQKCLAAAPDR